MASPIDPLDDEIRLVVSDPAVRASLDEFLASEARGDLESGIPDDELRRMLGFAPSANSGD